MTAPFGTRLARAVAATAPVVVGIDPGVDRIPPPWAARLAGLEGGARREAAAELVARWAAAIVEGAAGIVPAVKPQAAFFEALGAPGLRALEATCRLAREAGLLVILDVKRGDIGSTAEAYAHAALDDDGPLGADAATVHPWMGPESLAPWVARTDRGKGLFVLLRTSNPGADAVQLAGAPPPAAAVARLVRRLNAEAAGGVPGPVGVVVGATLGGGIAAWRAAVGDAWMLLPGYGAQGAPPGPLRAALEAGPGLVAAARAVTVPPPGEVEAWAADPAGWTRRRCSAFAAAFRGVTRGRTSW